MLNQYSSTEGQDTPMTYIAGFTILQSIYIKVDVVLK